MSDVKTPVNAFGSVTKVNEIKRKAGIKITTTTEEKEERLVGNPSEQAFRIGGMEEEPTVSDEELNILRNTILRNNPEEVYMQEDMTFYDSYYLSEHHIDDALMEEVRKIRRIYKNYPKYLYACYIRDKYLDLLEEKYGTSSPLAFKMGMTTIAVPRDTFIPPEPIYSRNAPDYNKSISDKIDIHLPAKEMVTEEIEQLLKHIGNSLDVNPEDIKVNSHGVMAKKEVLDFYFDGKDDNSSYQYSGRSINVKDLDAIQKMIRSWNKPEEPTTLKEEKRIMFPDSEKGREERIRWRFNYELAEAIEHPEVEKDTDMVYDDVTNKPMTRKELNQRKLARMLEDYGWDALKIMTQLGIGTKVDRMITRTKNKRRKKSKKKAAGFFDGIMGGDDTYDDPINDVDDLRRLFFDND